MASPKDTAEHARAPRPRGAAAVEGLGSDPCASTALAVGEDGIESCSRQARVRAAVRK